MGVIAVPPALELLGFIISCQAFLASLTKVFKSFEKQMFSVISGKPRDTTELASAMRSKKTDDTFLGMSEHMVTSELSTLMFLAVLDGKRLGIITPAT